MALFIVHDASLHLAEATEDASQISFTARRTSNKECSTEHFDEAGFQITVDIGPLRSATARW